MIACYVCHKEFGADQIKILIAGVLLCETCNRQIGSPLKMTMRELLDVLRSATEEERREFSTWWGDLPWVSSGEKKG